MRPAQETLLRSFLSGLPPATAAELARAIEHDRRQNGRGLPHDAILESLRPALRQVDPEGRMFTPLRLFCQPFEDLLTSRSGQDKLKGRIARESIEPVWDWIGGTLLPAETQQYAALAQEAIQNRTLTTAYAHAETFWQTASVAMRAALAPDRHRAALDLLGAPALADAEEMALLLSVGAQVLEIQKNLPRGTAALTEDLIWALREIYDALLSSHPDAAPYVTVITMSRLAKPWEALRLPLMIVRKTQDTLLSSTDMGLAGELLFHDLEYLALQICAVRPVEFDADLLVRHLTRFTELSAAVVKEVDIRRDGRWGQVLMRDRALVGETMQSLMTWAIADITAAIPMRKSGSYGAGPRVPNIEHAPLQLQNNERALRSAKLLAGCRHLAARASFGAKHRDAEDEVERELRAYNEEIVKLARDRDETRRAKAQPFFKVAVELTAILFSEDEADFLRRRARANPAA